MQGVSGHSLSSSGVSITSSSSVAPKSSHLSTSVSVSSPGVPLVSDVVSISAVTNNASSNTYSRPAVDVASASKISSESDSNEVSADSAIAIDSPDLIEGQEQEAVDRAPTGSEERRKPDDSSSTLNEQQRQQISELSFRDQAVRAHEQAHKSVGGQYTGSVSLSYQTGPDGKRYAVGGEVPIDVSPVPGDPLATIAKMRTVKAAANAPVDPSAQDRKVAAAATQLMTRAQIELSAQKRTETTSIGFDSVSGETRDRAAEAVKTYEDITGLNQSDENEYEAFA